MSFGGPAGQIAIMHHDLVDSKRWISERRFLHALNYCMVLPGPEAQQLATYIGWLMHRTWGGVIAGALFVLPSLVVLIALSWLYMAYGSVPAVAGILYGIKPAVVAIVLHAAWRIGSRALKRPVLWVIAALAFVAIFAFSVPFPAIVLAAGIVGYVGGRLAPDEFAMGGGHGASGGPHAPAVIDDDTPTPPHALFRWSRLVQVVACLRAALAVRARHAGRELRPRRDAAADGLVLHQGRAADLRRRLRGAAVRLPGRGRDLRLAQPGADDRRPRPGRDDAGPADHDRRLRRIRRRLDEGAVRRRFACAGRDRRSVRRDLLHVPAELPVHPRRRSAGRDRRTDSCDSPRR